MQEEIDVRLVSNLGCKPCGRVKKRLDALKAEFPGLRVSEIDLGSAEGTEIAVRYRLAALPGILINGRMVLVGDVSETLLRERLAMASNSRTIRA